MIYQHLNDLKSKKQIDLPFDFSIFVFTLVVRVILFIFVLAYLLLSISFGAKFSRWVARYSILRFDTVWIVNYIVKLFVYLLNWLKSALFVEVCGLLVYYSFQIRFLFPFIYLIVGDVSWPVRVISIILNAIFKDVKILGSCLLIHDLVWV